MKKLLIFLLIIILCCAAACGVDQNIPAPFFTPSPTLLVTPEPTAAPLHDLIITKHKDLNDQALLWDLLNKYTENEYMTAGILAYYWRESSGRSDSCAGWYYNDVMLQTDTSKDFTAEIDAGLKDGSTKQQFFEIIRYKYGGYGLGQWCSERNLNNLYDFAQEWGTSIGDAEMQCAFTVEDMKLYRTELYEELKNNVNDPIAAGRAVGWLYDGAPQGANYMGYLAEEFYNQYAKKAE